MAKYTKKEFADLCGVATNYLSSYIRQGYINVDEEDLIDSEDPVNFRFLSKRVSKQAKKPNVISSPQYIPKTEGQINPLTGEPLPEYEESERLVKFWDAEKRAKEVEKLQIEIDKKRGEVIPSELIEPFILLHSQSLTTEFKNAMDDMLRNVGHLYQITINDMADFKGYVTGRINEALDKATDSTVRQMQQLIREYADKRGVGERVS